MAITKSQKIALDVFINSWPEEWTWDEIIQGIYNEAEEIEVCDFYMGISPDFIATQIRVLENNIYNIAREQIFYCNICDSEHPLSNTQCVQPDMDD